MELLFYFLTYFEKVNFEILFSLIPIAWYDSGVDMKPRFSRSADKPTDMKFF